MEQRKSDGVIVPENTGEGVAIGMPVTTTPLAQIPACAPNALSSCLVFWRQSGVEVEDKEYEQGECAIFS